MQYNGVQATTRSFIFNSACNCLTTEVPDLITLLPMRHKFIVYVQCFSRLFDENVCQKKDKKRSKICILQKLKSAWKPSLCLQPAVGQLKDWGPLFWCAGHCSGVQATVLVCRPLFWCAVHCSGVQVTVLVLRPLFWCLGHCSGV